MASKSETEVTSATARGMGEDLGVSKACRKGWSAAIYARRWDCGASNMWPC